MYRCVGGYLMGYHGRPRPASSLTCNRIWISSVFHSKMQKPQLWTRQRLHLAIHLGHVLHLRPLFEIIARFFHVLAGPALRKGVFSRLLTLQEQFRTSEHST